MATRMIEAKLAELRRELRREWKPSARRIRAAVKRAKRLDVASASLALLRVIAIVTLPFLVHVRASVYFYQHHGGTWSAILFGALLTLCVVAAYGVVLSRRIVRRARSLSVARWIALPVVAAWTLYSAFYLASVNAKSDEVRDYYSAVHPILRVALSTVILVDPDLVITDTRREPQDYLRMGLPIYDQTKHYQQVDGWVHAVDLRTLGRSEMKNRTVQLYFWTMGFSTRRHVGTADHLHIQLRARR